MKSIFNYGFCFKNFGLNGVLFECLRVTWNTSDQVNSKRDTVIIRMIVI